MLKGGTIITPMISPRTRLFNRLVCRARGKAASAPRSVIRNTAPVVMMKLFFRASSMSPRNSAFLKLSHQMYPGRTQRELISILDLKATPIRI